MNKKTYIKLMIYSIILYTLLNIAHPITPSYVLQRGLDKWVFGLFFALMSLGTLLTAPVWGAYGDKHGRRLTLLIGTVMYAVAQIFFGVFTGIIGISIARFVAGLFSSAMKVGILSYITGSKKLQKFNKGKLISYYVSATLIGGSLGSFVGGQIGAFFKNEYQNVLFIQAALLILLGIIAFIVFPMDDEAPSKKIRKNSFSSFKEIGNLTPWYAIFFVLISSLSIVFVSVPKYVDVYFSDQNLSTSTLGNFGLVSGILVLLTNLFVTPYIIKKFGALRGSYITGILGAIALGITFSAGNFLGAIYSIYFVYYLASTINQTSTTYFLSNNKEMDKGVLFGFNESFKALGAIIGPFLGGFLYEYNSKLFFYVCAAILLISELILFIIAKEKNRHKNSIIEEDDKEFEFNGFK